MTDAPQGAAPLVTLVVALAANGVIGREGALPWRLPEDLRRFKAATLGKPVIMGRRTFESIGRALPARHNIVLTRRSHWNPADPAVTVVGDWPAALRAAGAVDEVMVIGGAEIYSLALPVAGRLLLTRVQADIEGDVRFPAIDPAEWSVLTSEAFPADERHAHAMLFESLVRRRPTSR
ncbi:MAG: dihydrofolate reductase [Steroidobacteraceae bacterium]